MFNTDLDGTLLTDARRIAAVDWGTLEELGELGVTRVVATGRSLWSALRVLPDDVPIDYLVFSSGVGTVRWRDRADIAAHTMSAAVVARVMSVLDALECDYMLQGPAPDSHRCAYRAGPRAGANADFQHRLELYAEHASALAGARVPATSQFVVIHPCAGGVGLWRRIVAALPELNVVRTTSPLDHRSVWVEVFPRGVSKADACAALARRHDLDHRLTMAVGNDYNDTDLLEWARYSFVVANGPADLRARHTEVASNGAGGVTESVQRWRRLVGNLAP